MKAKNQYFIVYTSVVVCTLLGFSKNEFVEGLFGMNSKPDVPLWEPIGNAPGVNPKNWASHDGPPVTFGARFVDLVNGMEFDDILRDTPDELRPPSMVFFFGSKKCPNAPSALKFQETAENVLPARERLGIFKYDMDTVPTRAWYKFTPEMDLVKRFGVSECPSIVFIPRRCNGWTEYCTKKSEDPILGDGLTSVGCENFKEQCTGFQLFDKADETHKKLGWAKWIMKKVEEDGEPQISPFLRTYAEQGVWITRRQLTTENNYQRNLFLAEAFPAFTPSGFLAIKTPAVVQDAMMDFWNRRKKNRRLESWNSEGTQLSFHDVKTTFVDMDLERRAMDKLANDHIKPLVEKWSGISPLELTSFYGIREYPPGSWLSSHIDRIDTHVLSVTFSICKLDPKTMEVIPDDSHLTPWPLEVTAFNGELVRYNHTAGTMVFYESSKLIHGRPYPNPDGAIHVAAFVHFKPMQMHGSDAKAWDDIARRARNNVKRWSTNAQYKSTPSVEPKNPVFSKKNYAESTIWKHLNGEEDEDEEELDNKAQFKVTFSNQSDRKLDLYWSGGDEHGDVLQASVAPGTSMTLHTYPFHNFFWAEEGTTEPVPGGKVTMDRGKSTYVYRLNLNAEKK